MRVVFSVLLLSVVAYTISVVLGDPNNELIKRATVYYIDPQLNEEDAAVIITNLKGLINKRSVKVIVHGYIANKDHVAIAPIKNAYLSKGVDSVLIADWQDASAVFYLTSRYFVSKVAKHFGSILAEFFRKHDIDPDDVHIIGHSLGAHVAGMIGKYFNGTIGRITGLDPAAPLFEGNSFDHLASNNAKFVDVIHTDIPAFGKLEPIGHVDFYPNYGYAPQPGCNLLDYLTATSCSHYRAPLFFAESIQLPNNFPAVKCTLREIKDFNGSNCIDRGKEDFIMMGEETPREARGVYYLETNNVSPYGRGLFSSVYKNLNQV